MKIAARDSLTHTPHTTAVHVTFHGARANDGNCVIVGITTKPTTHGKGNMHKCTLHVVHNIQRGVVKIQLI